MNDPVPDHSNRLAVLIGRILHPYVLPLPTMLIMLNDLPLPVALRWIALAVGIILFPAAALAAYKQQRGQMLYQRQTRGPLYLLGWSCVLLCLLLFIVLDAPTVLTAAVAVLALWAPLQGAINALVTKVSGHTAVAAGCFTTLLVLGKLAAPPVFIVALALVMLTTWARVVTRNHTPTQVVLGVLAGVLPVLVVFLPLR